MSFNLGVLNLRYEQSHPRKGELDIVHPGRRMAESCKAKGRQKCCFKRLVKWLGVPQRKHEDQSSDVSPTENARSGGAAAHW